MARLGMQEATDTFAHPGVPPGHALCPHCLYRLSQAHWRMRAAEPVVYL
jgi:hypothetical protein